MTGSGRALALVGCVAAISGCGDDASSDAEQVADVASRYITAVLRGDHRAACATRSAAEATATAERYGSCTDLMAAVYTRENVAKIGFSDLRVAPDDVRVDGDRASLQLRNRGERVTISAIKERGRWVLHDDRAEDPPIYDAPPANAIPSADAKAIARVANQLYRSLVAGDARAVCRTQTRAVRRRVANPAGSCVAQFTSILRRLTTAERKLMDAHADPATIQIDGDRATVPILRRGSRRPIIMLTAVRERGRWLLNGLPAAASK